MSLPGDENTIVGYSGVAMIVIDEAARVGDGLYHDVSPMLAVSKGTLVALSSPYGKRGWFYEAWEQGGNDWERYKVRADECPRITPAFLAQQKRTMGEPLVPAKLLLLV